MYILELTNNVKKETQGLNLFLNKAKILKHMYILELTNMDFQPQKRVVFPH